MYKIHLYDTEARRELEDITIKSCHELYDLKHINYNYDSHQVFLVTIVEVENAQTYEEREHTCRTFLVYNPYKNLWRAILRRFESMASHRFMELLFQ